VPFVPFPFVPFALLPPPLGLFLPGALFAISVPSWLMYPASGFVVDEPLLPLEVPLPLVFDVDWGIIDVWSKI
jgi:hypothetical protein